MASVTGNFGITAKYNYEHPLIMQYVDNKRPLTLSITMATYGCHKEPIDMDLTLDCKLAGRHWV